MTLDRRVAGVVLTGGNSTRMGSDKALLLVNGVAMAQRVAEVLDAAGCQPVWCQGGDLAGLAAIGLQAIGDDHPGRGPVAAIAQAAAAAAPDPVVVCACDLVDIDSDTIELLLRVAAQRPELDAVVAVDASGPHLLGVFQGGAAARLAELVVAGVASFRAAIDRIETCRVECDPQVLRNVNWPHDMG